MSGSRKKLSLRARIERIASGAAHDRGCRFGDSGDSGRCCAPRALTISGSCHGAGSGTRSARPRKSPSCRSGGASRWLVNRSAGDAPRASRQSRPFPSGSGRCSSIEGALQAGSAEARPKDPGPDPVAAGPRFHPGPEGRTVHLLGPATGRSRSMSKSSDVSLTDVTRPLSRPLGQQRRGTRPDPRATGP